MKRVVLVLILSLGACASGFKLEYYGIGPDKNGNLAGTILGPTEDKDMDLAVKCMPDDIEKGKCALLFSSEVLRVQDYIKQLEIRIKELESGCK